MSIAAAVATLLWPRVAWTTWIGAPRSSAWLAWAWRNQRGDSAPERPARRAAASPIRNTCERWRWPPRWERKTGAAGPASPRSVRISRQMGGRRMCRVLPPLPCTVTWPPSSCVVISSQHIPTASLTRGPPPEEIGGGRRDVAERAVAVARGEPFRVPRPRAVRRDVAHEQEEETGIVPRMEEAEGVVGRDLGFVAAHRYQGVAVIVGVGADVVALRGAEAEPRVEAWLPMRTTPAVPLAGECGLVPGGKKAGAAERFHPSAGPARRPPASARRDNHGCRAARADAR